MSYWQASEYIPMYEGVAVYALYAGKKLVYVGVTYNLNKRLCGGANHPYWDVVKWNAFVDGDVGYACYLERKLLVRLKCGGAEGMTPGGTIKAALARIVTPYRKQLKLPPRQPYKVDGVEVVKLTDEQAEVNDPGRTQRIERLTPEFARQAIEEARSKHGVVLPKPPGWKGAWLW